jgi:hypothetical protein
MQNHSYLDFEDQGQHHTQIHFSLTILDCIPNLFLCPFSGSDLNYHHFLNGSLTAYPQLFNEET